MAVRFIFSFHKSSKLPYRFKRFIFSLSSVTPKSAQSGAIFSILKSVIGSVLYICLKAVNRQPLRSEFMLVLGFYISFKITAVQVKTYVFKCKAVL